MRFCVWKFCFIIKLLIWRRPFACEKLQLPLGNNLVNSAKEVLWLIFYPCSVPSHIILIIIIWQFVNFALYLVLAEEKVGNNTWKVGINFICNVFRFLSPAFNVYFVRLSNRLYFYWRIIVLDKQQNYIIVSSQVMLFLDSFSGKDNYEKFWCLPPGCRLQSHITRSVLKLKKCTRCVKKERGIFVFRT